MHSSIRFETLIDVLKSRAAQTPDKSAYIFLRDGNKDEERITYAELHAKAMAIASAISEVAKRGDSVLINHHPGLEYISAFMGCFYAGVTAVPVYPPRFNQKLDRLLSIIRDVKPVACLSSKSVLDALRPVFSEHPEFEKTNWIPTDVLEIGAQESFQLEQIPSDALAFIQYTSGSTSAPKGVMLTHANLMNNLELISSCCEASESDVGVIWLPPYHDMGLIGGLLTPLFNGFPVVLLSPFAFLQRPHRWLQAISRYRGTISSAPNFAYELCVQRVTDKQLSDVDLSSWRVAFCGAEPIHAEVLDHFSDRFAPYQFKSQTFYPCYGMAESTLILTGGRAGAEPKVLEADKATFELEGRYSPPSGTAKSFVGCGEVLKDHDLRIVDPSTLEVCEPGRVGEIWFSGPSVAAGYWEKPEVTRDTFQATLAEQPGKKYLRTGDLGFLWENELYVTGRIKDLLILRGKNYYPQDIERTVGECHPLLKKGACAAFSVEDSASEQLVVIQEVQRRAQQGDLDEMISLIQKQVLEEHGINPFAISLIRTNSIPLTSSGKIQRSASRKLFLENGLPELKRFMMSATA